jgi:hypothetical protein
VAPPNIKNFYLPITRHHVPRGSDWGQTVGTDYWLTFNPAADLMATATAGTIVDELVDGGWTATSMVNTAGSGGDFAGGTFTKTTTPYVKSGPFDGSYGDLGTPNHALTNASGDILLSPAVFGDAVGMEAAAILAGKSVRPRYLIAEFFASFTVASADEVTSAIGFFEDGATASTEADQYAVIKSNGVNYQLAGNAATLDTGALIDSPAAWHKWKIVVQLNGTGSGVPNIYWYDNGAIQNTTAAAGIADEFPLKFGLHALTTNRIGLGLTHIFYDW